MRMMIEFLIVEKGDFSGAVGLVSWVSGLNSRQGGGKFWGPFQFLVLSKVDNF